MVYKICSWSVFGDWNSSFPVFLQELLIVLVLVIMVITLVHCILAKTAALSSDDHYDDITKRSRQSCYVVDYEDG